MVAGGIRNAVGDGSVAMFVQPPTLSARASWRGMATTEHARALENTNASLRAKKTCAPLLASVRNVRRFMIQTAVVLSVYDKSNVSCDTVWNDVP
jgi:hypothetical protein